MRHGTKILGNRQVMSAFLRNRTPVSSPSRGSDICLLSYFFNTWPHVRDTTIRDILACEIRNPGKFCKWNPEPWALESGIQLKQSGIPLTIGIQNPSSTDKDWNPVPSIRNPGRGIQNPTLSWIRLYGVKHSRRSGRKVYYYWTSHHDLTIMYQSKVWTNR